jgi:hypothetical protein
MEEEEGGFLHAFWKSGRDLTLSAEELFLHAFYKRGRDLTPTAEEAISRDLTPNYLCNIYPVSKPDN